MLRIEADVLIPGRGDPIRNAALIVDGPTIAYAGPIEGAPSAAGATVVNVPALMPGMWDVHGHFMGIRTLNVEEITRTPLAVLAARATKDAEVAVSAGFTSIRELCGLGVHLARAVAEGTVHGPRIYGAGGALSQTGGHGDLHAFPLDFIEDVLRRTGFSYLCDGVPECLKGGGDQRATSEGIADGDSQGRADRDGIRHLHVRRWTGRMGAQRPRGGPSRRGRNETASGHRSRDGDGAAYPGPTGPEKRTTPGRIRRGLPRACKKSARPDRCACRARAHPQSVDGRRTRERFADLNRAASHAQKLFLPSGVRTLRAAVTQFGRVRD